MQKIAKYLGTMRQDAEQRIDIFQLSVPLKGKNSADQEVEATLVYVSAIRASRVYGLSDFPKDETLIFAAGKDNEFSCEIMLAANFGSFATFQTLEGLGYKITL